MTTHGEISPTHGEISPRFECPKFELWSTAHRGRLQSHELARTINPHKRATPLPHIPWRGWEAALARTCETKCEAPTA